MFDETFEDRLIARLDLQRALDATLTDRQKSIVLARLKGVPLAEIGVDQGLSIERVRQIAAKSIRKLQVRLREKSDGVDRREITSHIHRLIDSVAARVAAREAAIANQIAADNRAEERRKWLERLWPTPIPRMGNKALCFNAALVMARSLGATEDHVIDISPLLPNEMFPSRLIVRHENAMQFRFDDGSTTEVPPGYYLVPARSIMNWNNLPDGVSVIEALHLNRVPH